MRRHSNLGHKVCGFVGGTRGLMDKQEQPRIVLPSNLQFVSHRFLQFMLPVVHQSVAFPLVVHVDHFTARNDENL